MPAPGPPCGADCLWCAAANNMPPPIGSTKCSPWHTRENFAGGTSDTSNADGCNNCPRCAWSPGQCRCNAVDSLRSPQSVHVGSPCSPSTLAPAPARLPADWRRWHPVGMRRVGLGILLFKVGQWFAAPTGAGGRATARARQSFQSPPFRRSPARLSQSKPGVVPEVSRCDCR